MNGGYRAQWLGTIAHTTFCDLLAAWIGPEYPLPSRVELDSQKIDVTHLMPSLSADVPPIQLNWQIKATERPRTVHSKVLNCECFRVDLSAAEVKKLLDLARAPATHYLALAVVRGEATAPPLPERPPYDRFTWYVVDTQQYASWLEQRPTFIEIPAQNRLGLALFSLLWGANWVRAFFDCPRPTRELPPALDALIKSFNVDLRELGQEPVTLLDAAIRPLGDVALKSEGLAAYAGRIAVVGSLRGVSAMLAGGPGAERIENYCPEALAGTANLWLFSRAYHEFMRMSLLRGEHNRRLLPVDCVALTDIPKFFLATLWDVGLMYRMMGAEVRLVRKLKDGGEFDYSFYSGAVGEFRWVTVDVSGRISLSEAKLSSTPEDLEALRTAQADTVASGGLGVSGQWPLGLDEIALEPSLPICLFPREDLFLEYPRVLWSGTGRSYYL